jgi:hypothetical protein
MSQSLEKQGSRKLKIANFLPGKIIKIIVTKNNEKFIDYILFQLELPGKSWKHHFQEQILWERMNFSALSSEYYVRILKR